MTRKKNLDVRGYAKQRQVFLWEIGEKLGINSFSITRRLRKELSDAEKTRIYEIIDKIADGDMNEGSDFV